MRRKEEKKESFMEASDYKVFSDVDINHHGDVGSYLPSWAYTQLIGDLESEISDYELQIQRQNISADKINELRRTVKIKKDRLEEILSSRPKLDKDKINDVRNSLSEKISEAMFSRSDMERGTADAHEEANRMVNPCIKLTEAEANFALGCNVKPTGDRKISRNQATKMWKIASRYLGENSNAEILRRG